MEELIVYLLKSGLCTIVFLGIYWLFLKNETFYRFNRYFLLAGIIASMVLPAIQYSYKVTLLVSAQLNQATETAAVVQKENYLQLWLYAVLLIYILVTCFLVFRHLAGLLKIKRMVNQHGYTMLQGYKVVNSAVFKQSFSVFNYIFFEDTPETSELEKKLILEHEQAHIAQYHWADLLITQLICSLQWFNPFAWMYMTAIKQNHEYLADQAVLQKGNSPAVYRAALINHSLKVQVFSFASSFAQYDKLKRVKMMMSPASKPLKKSGVLLVIPFFALFLMAFAKPVYTVVYQDKQKNDKNKLINNEDRPKTDQPKLISVAKTGTELRINDSTERYKNGLEEKQANGRLTDQEIADTGILVQRKRKLTQESEQKESLKHVLTDTIKRRKQLMPFVSPGYSEKTNGPFYILDGVEIDEKKFSAINSKDIESVKILKDQSAVDQYGISAINGVIIITLKTGKSKSDVK